MCGSTTVVCGRGVLDAGGFEMVLFLGVGSDVFSSVVEVVAGFDVNVRYYQACSAILFNLDNIS